MESKYRLLSVGAAEDALSQLVVQDRGDEGRQGSRRRRPQRASAYHLARRAGLAACARGMGLSPERLADNVDAGFKKTLPGADPQVGGLGCLRKGIAVLPGEGTFNEASLTRPTGN